jgi:hypothetical protein
LTFLFWPPVVLRAEPLEKDKTVFGQLGKCVIPVRGQSSGWWSRGEPDGKYGFAIRDKLTVRPYRDVHGASSRKRGQSPSGERDRDPHHPDGSTKKHDCAVPRRLPIPDTQRGGCIKTGMATLSF